MRIKDLISQTGVSRETIHYYLREGLLPPSRKTKANQAVYGQEHVERLQLIKDLQERFFLPLTVMKKIFDESRITPGQGDPLPIKADYFQPVSYLSQEELVGEEAFLQATGMSRDRLLDFEAQGIISPKRKKSQKVYSPDDLAIGRVIGDMRRMGLSAERGFSREAIKNFRDQLKIIVDQSIEDFWQVASKTMTPAEAEQMTNPAIEIMAICCYHLARRLFIEGAERVRKNRN